jgi:hypothetical protein
MNDSSAWASLPHVLALDKLLPSTVFLPYMIFCLTRCIPLPHIWPLFNIKDSQVYTSPSCTLNDYWADSPKSPICTNPTQSNIPPFLIFPVSSFKDYDYGCHHPSPTLDTYEYTFLFFTPYSNTSPILIASNSSVTLKAVHFKSTPVILATSKSLTLTTAGCLTGLP